MEASNLRHFDRQEINDKKIGAITSFSTMLILLILLYFISFSRKDEILDIKKEVIVEVPLEEFIEAIPPSSTDDGGGGGGTPTDDQVDPNPKPQAEEVLTSPTSEVATNSGKSNNQNQENAQNTSSTIRKAANPFGDGGNGGGSGGGNGKGTGFGKDEGSGSGSGGGNGNGTKPRIRLNDPNTDGIESDQNCKILLKLTINAEGDVIKGENIVAKTTTTNQLVINQVISNVKSQVKYNKKEGAAAEIVFLTVNVSAK